MEVILNFLSTRLLKQLSGFCLFSNLFVDARKFHRVALLIQELKRKKGMMK